MTPPGRALRDLIAAPHPDRAPLPPAAPDGRGVRVLRGVPYAEVEGSRPGRHLGPNQGRREGFAVRAGHHRVRVPVDEQERRGAGADLGERAR